MQTLELNLASRPFKNDTLLWAGFMVGLLLLGGATWWNIQTYLSHRDLIASVHETNTSMRQRFSEVERRGIQAVNEIESYDLDQLALRANAANEVIRWKSFSWTKLFNHLEKVQPWDVQMTSVHPVFRSTQGRERSIDDPEKVPVSVEGVARNNKEFFKLQRSLIFDPHFSQVDPEGYNTDQNSGETVFRMRFYYDPRVIVEETDAEETVVADAAVNANDDAPAPAAAADAPAETAAAEVQPADGQAQAASPEQVEEPADELASDDTLKRIPRRGRRGNAAAKKEGN